MTLSRRLLLPVAILAGITAASLEAKAAEPYLTAAQLDLTALIPPPPQPGSDADKADVAAVLAAQANASEARKAGALADSDQSIYQVFTPVLGEKFTKANTPKAAAFFERIGKSEGATLNPAKDIFKRVRPWIAHTDIKPVAEPTKSFCYPSGHVTRAAMFTIMMAAIVPEKKAEIWARAQDYAQSRVIGGMHYPSDVAVSWSTGAAMSTLMLQQPGFQADMAAARAEIRGLLGL